MWSATGFYTREGGPTDWEDPGEKPEPVVEVGPLSWADVVDRYLRPHRWLEQHPQSIHLAIAPLVASELAAAIGISDAARERWVEALRPAEFRRDIAEIRATRVWHSSIHRRCLRFRRERRSSNHGDRINAYVSEEHWPMKPECFADWFEKGVYPFQRAVVKASGVIASTLIDSGSPMFRDLRYAGISSVFHTNAVRSYLPKATGLRSDHVTRDQFERHIPTWHAEIDLMTSSGRMPHVIVVFGRPGWEAVWQAFHPRHRPTFQHLTVTRFSNASGEADHHANLVDFDGPQGPRSIVLLEVKHPSARANSIATPEWVLSRPDVRKLLQMPG